MSSVHLLATALLAVLLAATSATLASDEDFGFEVSDDLEVEFNSDNTHHHFASPPSKLVATVGQIFHYALPKEDHSRYEVKRANGLSLPSWLMFDKVGGVFWGVPLAEDSGKVHVLLKTIKAAATSTYEFTLIVNASDRPNKCLQNEDSTVLALMVDKDVQAIKPKQRIIAINNIAKFFGLSKSAFTLETHNGDDLADSAVILAGPGTVKFPSHKRSSAVLVNVGCDGRLWENFATIVHQLKQQARDGTITEVLGLPLIGWRVLSQSKSSRLRRQADDFGAGGSGDYDDDYYDEYDNYDDEEYDYGEKSTKAPTTSTTTTTTRRPTTMPTKTTTTTTTTPLPPTTIPTTAKPESTTHHHRHHHGQILVESTSTSSTNATSPIVSSTSTSPLTSTIPPTTTTTAPSTISPITITSTSEPTTSSVKPIDTINSLYDDNDDDDDEYDDEDDLESETEVPDLTVVDVDPKLELAPDTESSFTDIGTTKVEVVEFVPETTPIPSTTIPTSYSPSTSMPSTSASPSTPPTSTATVSSSTFIPTTEPITFATTMETTISETSSIPQTTSTELINATFEVVANVTDKVTTQSTTTEQEISSTVKLTTARHLTTQRTTTVVTESIEYELKNFPPTIQNRLKRIATTAGKAFSYVVPINTFTDLEDGTDLRLEFLDGDGKPLNKSSWCQFNHRSREIYGLPLEEDVSRWEYVIRATDQDGASVQDVVEILVQNHKSRRVVNHEFSLYLHIEKKWEFPHDVDWALKTLRGIGQLYRSNLSDITVRRVNYTSEPVVFVWTNDSLPKSYCPTEQINGLFELLTANNEGDPSHALTRALIPELRIKKVMYHGLGVCESKPQPPPQAPITPPTNFSPILRNPVDHINATVGELLVFAVPDDTFYDPEDQDSRNLKMTLLTIDRQPIPSNHWLQFDSKNKEFYGIPLPNNIGRSEYQLVCEDSGGLPASDSLVVVVHPPPKLPYNVEFSMILDTPFESFASSANMQRKFVEKIRDLFGDQNTSHIHLSSINRGSTIVNWYNKSLSLAECPRAQIKRLESVLVNNDRTIASKVQDIMDPEFKVSTIKLQLIGVCKGRPHIQSPNNGQGVPIEEPPLSDHEDYLITFIIPAVIISSMLVVAGIAACVLYRRRRSGKLNVEEDGRGSYGNKGIPVIFQEELEEKPEPGTKAPIILKDEKPPLAPPEYSKSGSLKLTDDSEPYQPPPPPFTQQMENNRHSRPKPTPTYRKPPPLNID